MYYYFNVWKAYTAGVLLLESEKIIHMKLKKNIFVQQAKL